MSGDEKSESAFEHAIAIIGMSCRVPGAENLRELWRNLAEGKEGVSRATQSELAASALPRSMLENPRYVPAAGRLEGIEAFDAGYFDITPSIAEVTSPQQRLLLESAEHALNDAGYRPERFDGRIGIYCAVESSDYAYQHLAGHADLFENLGYKTIQFANDPTFSATQVAYRLNLTGPAVNVCTACSSSLVAIHLACKSLLDYEADIMLAGGASYSVHQGAGYIYQEGGIGSSDGHCRAFDAAASGTVSGNGVGMVVLKRLEDAIEDRDAIYAVILASAINNDGNRKLSYSAAGLEGQAEVIGEALALAGVSAEDIGYVEAHGTGTRLGDPVEVAALTETYRESTPATGYCGLGSLKSNIGHLGCAAGVAGIVKTALSMHHRQIPPTLHVTTPNPNLDLDASPFYLVTSLRPWPATKPYAGVSSFGMGGTNAHAILAPWPGDASAPAAAPGPHILLLSARSPAALGRNAALLARHLGEHPDENLADVAYTLRIGRRTCEHRIAVVAEDREQAVRRLEEAAARAERPSAEVRGVVMMFPGQGNQHVAMGKTLHARCAAYRAVFTECCRAVKEGHGLDLEALLLGDDDVAERARRLRETSNTQIALFVVEYALARTLIDLGLEPRALIGHSIGEYVAATLAGVLPLEAALDLVCVRGRLMQALPRGAMAAVHLPVSDVEPLLPTGVDVAAINRRGQTVVAGPEELLQPFLAALEESGVASQRLSVSHAFHSNMMRGGADALRRHLAGISLQPPKIPFVSNLTGEWITSAEATDPCYWVEQMCGTVRFRAGIDCLVRDGYREFLEVGPGRSIRGVFQEDERLRGLALHPCMSDARAPDADLAVFSQALANLWQDGRDLDWNALDDGKGRRRLHLPGYAFDRDRYWIEPKHLSQRGTQGVPGPEACADAAETAAMLYAPTWRPSPVSGSDRESGPECWVVIGDEPEIVGGLCAGLEDAGHVAVEVLRAESVETVVKTGRRAFAIDPRNDAHYDSVIDEIAALSPRAFVYCPTVSLPAPAEGVAADTRAAFHDLLAVHKALARASLPQPPVLFCLGRSAAAIRGEETIHPSLHMSSVLCRSLNQDPRGPRCVYVDVDLPADAVDCAEAARSWAGDLVQERERGLGSDEVAYRDGERYVRAYSQVDPERLGGGGIKRGGRYLVTGGWGGIGFEIARHLAQKHAAKLVLVGRNAPLLPASLRAQWPGGEPEREVPEELNGKLRVLTDLGAEVVSIPASVADAESFERAVELARSVVGRIDGVFHAAGVPGGGLLSQQTTDDIERTFAPKVAGSLNVIRVFEGEAPDFILLFSSQNALKGGALRADYSSANAFMDGLAEYLDARSGTRVVAVNWCAWADVGMLHEHLEARGHALSAEKSRESLRTPEGLELVERLTKASCPRVVVSKRPISEVLDRAARQDKRPASSSRDGARPRGVSSELVAPQSDIARQLQRIWQDVLRIDAIGINDNFFELGGNSLLAVQIVIRIRDLYGVDLPLEEFLLTPTIDHAETLVLRLMTENADLADLERLLAEVGATAGMDDLRAPARAMEP